MLMELRADIEHKTFVYKNNVHATFEKYGCWMTKETTETLDATQAKIGEGGEGRTGRGL